MWSDERWRAVPGAGFVFKYVLLPFSPVHAALDRNLRPVRRHNREKAVGADRTERRNGAVQLRNRSDHPVFAAELKSGEKPICLPEKQATGNSQEEAEKSDSDYGKACAEPSGSVFHVDAYDLISEFRRYQRVVKQWNAQHDGEPIEKRIVTSGENNNLQPDEGECRQQAEPAWGKQEKRYQEFQHQGGCGREFVHACRQVMHIPRSPGGDRLGLIVNRHGAHQGPPRFVSAADLDQPRSQHQPEHEPSV